jgi:hypothetical protein
VSQTPPETNTPFGSARNYPGAVGYHEQRRCFGGTDNKPQNFWATRSATENNLSYSITTRDDDATLTLTSGTVSLQSVGGLKFNSGVNANLQLSPGSGDPLTFLENLCDLSAFEVGQTLMIGAEIETPAGWAAAVVDSTTVLSVGGLGLSDDGGWAVGYASNERPTLFWRSAGARATATITNLAGAASSGSLVDSSRNVVVYELQCTAANTFKARAHLSSSAGTTYTGAWSAETDLSNSDT